MVFDGAANLKQLDLLEEGLEFVLKRHPKYSTFAYLRSALLEKPPAGMNERAQAIENRLQAHIVSKVMVVVPTGLSAVLIRSFLAVQSLMSANLPTKVFRDDHEAVTWLQALPTQLPEIQSMTNLTAVLRRFGLQASPKSRG